MVKVGIVGGTGYTGVELLRLLASHEEAEVVAITSRAESGRRLDDLYPNLRGIYDLAFSEPDVQAEPEEAQILNSSIINNMASPSTNSKAILVVLGRRLSGSPLTMALGIRLSNSCSSLSRNARTF